MKPRDSRAPGGCQIGVIGALLRGGSVWKLSFRSAVLSREEPAACPSNSRLLTGLSARFGMTKWDLLKLTHYPQLLRVDTSRTEG